MQVLNNWFARRNVDNMVIFVTIFITGTNQVCSITDNIVPLQSGSVFYERAKLTGAQYNQNLKQSRNLPWHTLGILIPNTECPKSEFVWYLNKDHPEQAPPWTSTPLKSRSSVFRCFYPQKSGQKILILETIWSQHLRAKRNGLSRF